MRKPVVEQFASMPTEIAESMSEFFYESEKFTSLIVPSRNYTFDTGSEFPPVPSRLSGTVFAYNRDSLNDRNPSVQCQAILLPGEAHDESATAAAEHLLAGYRFVAALQEMHDTSFELSASSSAEAEASREEVNTLVKELHHDEKIRTFGAFLVMQSIETGEHYAGIQISRKLRDEPLLEIRQKFVEELSTDEGAELSDMEKDVLQVGDRSLLLGYIIASRFLPPLGEVQRLIPGQAKMVDETIDRKTKKSIQHTHRKLAKKNFQEAENMYRSVLRRRQQVSSERGIPE